MATSTRPAIVSTFRATDTTERWAAVIGSQIGSTEPTGGTNTGLLTLTELFVPPADSANTFYNLNRVPMFVTNVLVRGAGTTGKIPKFTTGADGIIGDSLYTEANITTIKAGGIGIASQAALDFIYAASSTQLARLAAGSALQAPRINAAGNGWEFASVGGLQWLQTTTGTTTAAGGSNLGTITFTGTFALSTTDSVLVVWNYRSTTQDTANVRIFNVSDSQDFYSGATATAGSYYGGSILLQKACDSDTVIVPAFYSSNLNAAVTTNPLSGGWTNSWQLALRQNGVTAGGTLTYRVSVYRVAGQ